MTRHDPTALLAAVLTLHWFTRCEGAMRAEAGHAVWLSVLAAGLMLTVLCLILRPFLPAKGLLAVCRMRKGLRFFPLVTAMLFLLLSAGAWRNALASLSRTLLPETPRHVTVLLMLPAIAVMSRTGIVPVMRAVKLSAPLLLTLFAALLLAAAWGQAAVSANLISPLLIIVVSIAGLGLFAVPSYPLSLAVRIARLGLLIASALAGFAGIVLVMMALITACAALESFGTPCFAPLAPSMRRNGDLMLTRLSVRRQTNIPGMARPQKHTSSPAPRAWDERGGAL